MFQAWNWWIDQIILSEFSFRWKTNHIVFWNFMPLTNCYAFLFSLLELDISLTVFWWSLLSCIRLYCIISHGIVFCCVMFSHVIIRSVVSSHAPREFLVSDRTCISYVDTISPQFRTLDIVSVFGNDSENNFLRGEMWFEHFKHFEHFHNESWLFIRLVLIILYHAGTVKPRR
jgi:hypothetical protein